MRAFSGGPIYGSNGTSYRLGGEIAKGAEGSVWTLASDSKLLAKLYHKELDAQAIAKLEAMCRFSRPELSRVAAWPITPLRLSRSGHPVGLLMRKVDDSYLVHLVYGIKDRLRRLPNTQFPYLLHAALNIARAFATVHAAGQVVGDVNHSNLMISRSATATLIDCDSFQFSDNGEVYRCGVGVPEFTPPELQGRNFSTITRTTQHDAFGLSVLIFYLLFLGRHPFMGMYDPNRNEMLSLDQAIGRYAFPYEYDLHSPEVKLPPFLPRLVDYPPAIGNAFRQAFTKDSISRGRPTAENWVTSLADFASRLKQCAGNPSHHFYNQLIECPWCRMEGVLGTPIFGVAVIVTTHAENFDVGQIWAQIQGIVITSAAIALPDSKALRAAATPDASLRPIVLRRRKFRSTAVLLIVIVGLVATLELIPLAALLAIFVALILGGKLWTAGAKDAKPFWEMLKDAECSYKDAEREFAGCSQPPAKIMQERQRLEAAKMQLLGLDTEKAKRHAALLANRELKQRQHFLESFRLEDANIPGIGPKFTGILRTWGIEDAWDVEQRRIESIKGFGPIRVQSLLSWRREKEQRFRFNPSQGIDPRDVDALEQEFQQKRQSLQNALLAGPQTLRQLIGVWNAQQRQAAARLHATAAALAQAQRNIVALRTF